MTSAYYLAWWNVENLFDEENSPRRTDKVARALGSSIVGWTPALRDRKIDQLASVIAQLNGAPPSPACASMGAVATGARRAATDAAEHYERTCRSAEVDLEFSGRRRPATTMLRASCEHPCSHMGSACHV